MGRKPKPKPDAVLEDVMKHLQTITLDRQLTQKELVECGSKLATEELQLNQVRLEKKEANQSFDGTIKAHQKEIMRLSSAIDTGTITDEIECEVVMNREKEVKTCYPKNGGKVLVIPMTSDDFDLLS